MKKVYIYFFSLILNSTCFSLEQLPSISIDNACCDSVWDILQNKHSENAERDVRYKGKPLKNVNQELRNILMDYAALFVTDCEENDMLLGHVAYCLGFDLRCLLEKQSYKVKISENRLALQLMAESRISGGASERFGTEVKHNRDALKKIISMVEKDAFE